MEGEKSHVFILYVYFVYLPAALQYLGFGLQVPGKRLYMCQQWICDSFLSASQFM